jgi:hypothetical protein
MPMTAATAAAPKSFNVLRLFMEILLPKISWIRAPDL